MGERHVALRLVRRVPKHDALVAGPHVQIRLAHVHAARNVGRLLVDAHQHLARVAGETLRVDRGEIVHEGVEANLLDLISGKGGADEGGLEWKAGRATGGAD